MNTKERILSIKLLEKQKECPGYLNQLNVSAKTKWNKGAEDIKEKEE